MSGSPTGDMPPAWDGAGMSWEFPLTVRIKIISSPSPSFPAWLAASRSAELGAVLGTVIPTFWKFRSGEIFWHQ